MDDGHVSLATLATESTAALASSGIEGAEREARWLVEEAAGLDPGQLATAGGHHATVGTVNRLRAMVERRVTGEPLQRVIGHWPFRTLDLLVDHRVLVPRPETELVVEVALAELDRTPNVEGRPRRIVDLGTGTGAIALSIAAEREEVEVLATDASAEALDVARANLAGIGRRGSAVTLYKGSWFSALPPVLAGSIDLLVSNPPYVAADEELPVEVGDWDPHRALVAGPGGTECLDLIVDAAPAWLARPASLVLELAPHQAQLVAGRATQAGATVMVHDDLSGRPRCVVARFS